MNNQSLGREEKKCVKSKGKVLTPFEGDRRTRELFASFSTPDVYITCVPSLHPGENERALPRRQDGRVRKDPASHLISPNPAHLLTRSLLHAFCMHDTCEAMTISSIWKNSYLRDGILPNQPR